MAPEVTGMPRRKQLATNGPSLQDLLARRQQAESGGREREVALFKENH
jgi:hypothetical protein